MINGEVDVLVKRLIEMLMHNNKVDAFKALSILEHFPCQQASGPITFVRIRDPDECRRCGQGSDV